jgi:hypothetical protein
MHQGAFAGPRRRGGRGRVVADVAKLSIGREEYYTRELASDHEAYQSGHEESSGRWYGAGLRRGPVPDQGVSTLYGIGDAVTRPRLWFWPCRLLALPARERVTTGVDDDQSASPALLDHLRRLPAATFGPQG